MRTLPPRTERKLRSALAAAGLDWKAVLGSAEQVILFGSCAAGCDGEQSDIDLLCIGDGPRRSCDGLHLLWLSRDVVSDPNWVSTEIGGHVAEYGFWLKGDRTLGPPRLPSRETVLRKTKAIKNRTTVLLEKWPQLPRQFRQREILKLRRDIQRLAVLQNGRPVPPSPTLDQEWRKLRTKLSWLKAVLNDDAEVCENTMNAFALDAARFHPFIRANS